MILVNKCSLQDGNRSYNHDICYSENTIYCDMILTSHNSIIIDQIIHKFAFVLGIALLLLIVGTVVFIVGIAKWLKNEKEQDNKDPNKNKNPFFLMVIGTLVMIIAMGIIAILSVITHNIVMNIIN